MKKIRDYSLLFGIAFSIVILDQISKAMVLNSVPSGGSWMPLDWLAPYARIVNWYNSGVAFGLFQGGGMIFAGLALIVAGGIIYYYPRIPRDEVLMRVAFGFMLGGALGNLIDRFRYGGNVIDFISVGNFPVFNVADSSVTIGVCLMLLASLLDNRKTKQQKAESLSPEGNQSIEK
jgi:signal peptidase II